MKKILLSLTLILAAILPAIAGGDWHDDLISTMNTAKNVERALAVDRDTKSGKIKQATYRYTFKNKSLYKSLRDKLINREHEAANFILRPGEDGAILLKFNSDEGFRNYSLSHVKGKYHLIVSVNSSEPFGIGDSSYSQEQAQRQREQAQRQAQLAREQAQRQAQLAREQAQRQREQAQRQAQLAREQARKVRAFDSKGCIIYVNDNSSTESESISKKLKAAENERKRLLNDN